MKKKWDIYNKFKKIKKIVLWAHNSAKQNIKPWILWFELDKISRNYIENNWYLKYFIHSTWHWVWLNIHEKPYISKKSENIIQKWMVFTIEPWIYLENEFWVRHENVFIC